MKKIMFILALVPLGLFGQIPGNPDAHGRITPGPPWVTGLSQGDGELKAQFGYVQDEIATNTSGIADNAAGIDSLQTGVFNIEWFGAISNDGECDSSSINSAIRASSVLGVATYGDWPTVYIPAGIWEMTGPIIPKNNVNIKIDPGAYFMFTSGYTGTGIEFIDEESQGNSVIYGGGTFMERTPALYGWTGIYFDKKTSYDYDASFIVIRDLEFRTTKYGVRADINNSGWANDIIFDNITWNGFIYGVHVTDGGAGNSQFRNSFVNCSWQASAASKTVFDYSAADGQWTNIINCRVWDMSTSDSTDWHIAINNDEYVNYDGTKIREFPDNPKHIMENNQQLKRMVRATVTYTQDGSVDTVAYLPNGAILWDIKYRLNTAFDDSGTDFIDIGHAGDTDLFSDNIDVSTGSGFTDVSDGDVPNYIFNRNYLTVTYDGANGDATQGSITVWFEYTIQ